MEFSATNLEPLIETAMTTLSSKIINKNKRKMAEALTLQKADLEEAIRKVKAKEEDMRQEQLRGGSSSGFRVKLAETKMPQRLNVWRVLARASGRASVREGKRSRSQVCARKHSCACERARARARE